MLPTMKNSVRRHQCHFWVSVVKVVALTMEGSSEVSGTGITSGTTTPDHQGPNLPGYFPYLSLVFKWITTLIILMMAGWVVFTIKTTRKLHKPHNIFVANLMITDIISVVLTTVQASIMMIGYATGLGDFINCRVYIFLLFPILVMYCTYLMISVNQVIAIALPYRYKKIMKCHTIAGVIAVGWLVPIFFYLHVFFNTDYVKSAQYGYCLENNSFILLFVTFLLPVFALSLIVLVLNVYLSFKAYQVQGKIRAESRLSGARSNEVNKLKKKQATIKTHLKPMITLLVVVLGSSSFGLLFPIFFVSARILEVPEIEEMMTNMVASNIGYLVFLVHPFVYGLYYKQIREPMMKVLKRVICRNKFNSATVAPQPRRTAWM